jgi:hypothetical protein
MPVMSRVDTSSIVRASEVGQHAYCARSWWLGRVKGYPSAHVQQMSVGRHAHRIHGRIVVRYQRLQRLAYAMLLLAALAAALGLCVLVRGR